MAVWFWRGLRRGVVTTRYPAVVDPWARELPSPPRFDPARLTHETADRLVGVCPSRSLRREHDVLVLDVGSCTACGRCIQVAGGAARPSGIFELAATDRRLLVKRVPIEGGP